jgi:hypothetical protein
MPGMARGLSPPVLIIMHGWVSPIWWLIRSDLFLVLLNVDLWYQEQTLIPLYTLFSEPSDIQKWWFGIKIIFLIFCHFHEKNWFHILPKSGIWLQKWLLPFNPSLELCRGGKHIIILALCTLHVVRLIFFQLTSSCPITLPKIKLDAPVDRERSHRLPSLSQWQGSSLSGCTSAFAPQKCQQRPVSWKEASCRAPGCLVMC